MKMTIKQLLLTCLFSVLSYTGYSQYMSVGINLRTHHWKRKNPQGNKYQEWNLGVFAGYTNKHNNTVEVAIGRNSWNKVSALVLVGQRVGDWEGQVGFATGYRVAGAGLVRPGYFLNYQAHNIKLRANHLIVTGGLYADIK